MELTPKEINGLISSTKFKKTGGFLSLLASLAASLLPTLLGGGLSKSEINTAQDVIFKKGSRMSKPNASKVRQRTAVKVVWSSWKQGASAGRHALTERSVLKNKI